MDRRSGADRKATATPTTTHYNQSVSEYRPWTRNAWNLVEDGLQQQEETPVPLLSEKNSNTRLRRLTTLGQQKLGENKGFQPEDFDGSVRICHKQHESMGPSCLQAGGGDVKGWRIFPQDIPNEHHLNTAAPAYCYWQRPSLYGHSVTIYYFQQDNARLVAL